MITEQQYEILLQMAVQFVQIDKFNGIELEFGNIPAIIQKTITASGLSCDAETKNRLFTDLEYRFKIVHTKGQVIYDDYDTSLHSWYSNETTPSRYFWGRYRSYLMEHSNIDIKSINLLDETTLPNIMNCLGNPNDKLDEPRLKRGLIIGDVQSGKTSTYTGLICKAADAGYKVVILLAGITESLRQQTQERIDEGIVGYSVRKVGRRQVEGRVGVGLDNKELKVSSFTSCAHDFTGDCDKISTSLSAHKSLVLFVIKKNVSVLAKLLKWLKEHNLDPVQGCVDEPMLLIDDEADNASINTKKDETDPTKTNSLIRQICCLFKNSTYIGFTATPFANVFIDPDSEDAMKNADLFPENFIYILPTPSNYIGAKRIFYDDGDCYGNLRYISDIDEPDYLSEEFKESEKYDIEALNSGSFYFKHKKEWRGKLPKSLTDAVYCFYLANAVRDLRGDSAKPRSMLVNISRFVKVQNYIREYIEQIHNDFTNVLRFDFSDISAENKSLALYQRLEHLWDKHFSEIHDIAFERVISKDTLMAAVEKISIVVVNGNSASKLDYKSHPSLRVIAVGGLALSRGLTLEGLLISYFYRNTATFDVLMQMGRWFGYRPKYEDLFQIWTSKMSADWYAEIARATEELKGEIQSMFDQQLTPKFFGLKVRDDSEELQITAANKMRKSFNLMLQYSFYGNMYDTPYISPNVALNKENLDLIKEFTEVLIGGGNKLRFADIGKHDDSKIDDPCIGASRFFHNVPKQLIVNLLSKIKVSAVNPRFQVDNILSFITSPETEGVEQWDVVFEGGDSNVQYGIENLKNIKCSTRAIYESSHKVIQISSRRRILGMREGRFAINKDMQNQAEKACRQAWIAEGVSEKEAKSRDIPLRAYFKYLPNRNPVLIILLIHPKPVDAGKENEGKVITKFREELGDDQIVAFAIGVPGIKNEDNIKYYKANKIYYELNMADEPDETKDDDE